MSDVGWVEASARDVGMDPAGLERAVALIDARRASAQLCVFRDDQIVLDRTFGCASDALFWTFSVSKPFVALAIHLLAERGQLTLDDPVALHWPEFARNGKDRITVRHVLTHRAGIPFSSGGLLGDVAAMADWDRSTALAENATPWWPAGRVVGYHILSYGFVLGEVVQRVSGMPVRDFVHANLLAPLGLSDMHLGLADAEWPRHVPLRGQVMTDQVRRVVFNRRNVRQAVVPAAGISATARSIATFYRMLLAGGELDGVRVLQPSTIEEARRISSDGEVDQLMHHPVRWAQGFQLGGPYGTRRPTGTHSDPRTFGHNGSSICNAWADPGRGLVFAYLTNLGAPRRASLRHNADVSDALLDACR